MTYHGEKGIRQIEQYGGIESICRKLHTSTREGILRDDVARRRTIFGTNAVMEKRPHSIWMLLWRALRKMSILFLFSVVMISIFTEVYEKGTTTIQSISTVWSVVFVISATVFNGYWKEKEYCNLQNRIGRQTFIHVIRQGELIRIPIGDIVVGDVCQIKYGEMIPVDGILILSYELKIAFLSMADHPEPIEKTINSDPFMHAGTYVVEGRGKMIAMAVGVNLQMNIPNKSTTNRKSETLELDNLRDIWTKQLKDTRDYRMKKSILQARLSTFATYCEWFAICLGLLAFSIQIVRIFFYKYSTIEKLGNDHLIEVLKCVAFAASVAIVACPEALPLSITMSLSYAVHKMQKENILLRRLDACEIMTYVTTIFTNKTICLSLDKVDVVASIICLRNYDEIFNAQSIPLHVIDMIVNCISINSAYTTRIPSTSSVEDISDSGSRLDYALLRFVLKLGKDYLQIRKAYPEEVFRYVFTFKYINRYMVTVIPIPDGYRLFCKGGASALLSKCSFIYGEEGILQILTPEQRETLQKTFIEKMALNCHRTVLMAYRDFLFNDIRINDTKIAEEPDWKNNANIIEDLTLICITGIEDQVHPEMYAAVAKCRKAGIVVRLITGTNKYNAKAIAVKCGIIDPEESNLVLDSTEFNERIRDSNGNVQQHLLNEVLPNLRVLSKSTPPDKYTLISGLVDGKFNEFGETVAVIGSNTTDVSALKRSHLGIVLGISGTEVAKDASDMILTDDNFNDIVRAVIWGRYAHDTISKFLLFYLTMNTLTILETFISMVFLKRSSLNSIQMLYISLIMYSVIAFSLAADRPTETLLLHPPYNPTPPLISAKKLKHIIGQLMYQLTVVIAMRFAGQNWIDFPSEDSHDTLIFHLIALMSLFNSLNVRMVHGERNIFNGLWRNLFFLLIWFLIFLDNLLHDEMTFAMHMLNNLFGVGTLVWEQLINCVPDRIKLKDKGVNKNRENQGKK